MITLLIAPILVLSFLTGAACELGGMAVHGIANGVKAVWHHKKVKQPKLGEDKLNATN